MLPATSSFSPGDNFPMPTSPAFVTTKALVSGLASSSASRAFPDPTCVILTAVDAELTLIIFVLVKVLAPVYVTVFPNKSSRRSANSSISEATFTGSVGSG